MVFVDYGTTSVSTFNQEMLCDCSRSLHSNKGVIDWIAQKVKLSDSVF